MDVAMSGRHGWDFESLGVAFVVEVGVKLVNY